MIALTDWTRPARTRARADSLAIALPLAIAVTALAWRLAGPLAAALVAPAAIAASVALAIVRAQRFDQRWLVRTLDSRRPDLEDSTDLLLADPAALNPLQSLQRDRLLARLADDTAATLAPPWHGRAIAAAVAAGLAITAAALFWPAPGQPLPGTTPAAAPAPTGPPQLLSQSLAVTPPAYTGLPARTQSALTARAPVGSRLAWRLRFGPQPATVALVLLYGRRLPLTRSSDGWTLTRSLDRSLLYRVAIDGEPLPALHRLDAIPDTPPAIRVVAPERTLTLVTNGQRRWRLAFEVGDDHGVAATARLRLIVTEGEGENIKFRETGATLAGAGPPRRRRFTADLDLAALGLTRGNDLVAQLIVTDNRRPAPQAARSPSLILRWPPDLGQQASGLDLVVKTVLPAYFRSQRQIIIDAEALLKDRRRLAPDRFGARSNALGTDQAILRQRYGRFLGDEVSEEPALPDGHSADDGHGHAPPKNGVGNEEDVLANYGHSHGDDDTATLVDPATRATLREALDAMFSSERNLRQAAPDKALPHAYIALRLIKKVQEATRIYLARTGTQLPSIDFDRRLTGDRKTLAAPHLAPVPRTPDTGDAVPAAAWAALSTSEDIPLDDLQRWLASAGPRVADPLAFAAAIDAVARDPACELCRRTLRGRVWQALATPPAQVTRRSAADAIGRRYLDALR